MEKQYDLAGCAVSVIYSPKLVRITGSKQLLIFLNTNLSANSLKLAKLIKADYLIIVGRRLKITNASLMVEIWGHLYASHFANAVKELIKLNIVGDLTDLITRRSDTIDCGEADIDSNRKFWDTLSKFNHIIVKCLPKP
ncbi:MAG TPA: hypothetical protein VL088_04135 [Pedobacter sp.]|nr:hypothetical protein [Pedobacter sp.]